MPHVSKKVQCNEKGTIIMHKENMELSANPNQYMYRKGLMKRGRKPRQEWVRKAIESCHTQAEWQEIVRSMDAKSQVDALIRVQPKEIKGDLASTFTLVINGLQQPAIRGEVVMAALEEHVEDDPDAT